MHNCRLRPVTPSFGLKREARYRLSPETQQRQNIRLKRRRRSGLSFGRSQSFKFRNPTNPTNASDTSCHEVYFTAALEHRVSSSESLSTAQSQSLME